MKYIRKQQEIKCDGCNTLFNKDVSEIKRNLKLNRKNYCSRTCLGIANISNLDGVERNVEHLNPGNRRDEFTLFRPHLRRACYRKQDCSLTLEQMKEVWDKQKGICVYSKVKLSESDNNKKNDPIYTISLDRIDSSKGYHKDNIQFISVAMNHLKNSMTHEQMLEIIRIIGVNG